MKKDLLIKCDNYRSQLCFLVLLPIISFALSGCQSMSNSVIAATGTTIGVEVSQNQATQTPMGVLGYRRAELAYVPTNKVSETKTTTDAGKKESEKHSIGNGARDSANVVMELKHQGIFDWSSNSGIYQRLAVGNIAVRQPGAQAMFLKNDKGEIDENAAKALQAARAAVSTIPVVTEKSINLRQNLIDAYLKCEKNNKSELDKFEAVAIDQGYLNFRTFMGEVFNEDKINQFDQSLKGKSVNCD